jgi:2-oxoglutarate dehydrogenase E1 component
MTGRKAESRHFIHLVNRLFKLTCRAKGFDLATTEASRVEQNVDRIALPIGGDMTPYLDLYGRYLRDPASVPEDWRLNFELMAPRQSGPGVSPLVENLIRAYERWGHFAADLDPLRLMPKAEPAELAQARRALSDHLDVTILHPFQPDAEIAIRDLMALLERIYAGPLAVEFEHVLGDEERT